MELPVQLWISIHSLRVEGDQPEGTLRRRHFLFQSTPSVWRETTLGISTAKKDHISIHSLRVEGDYEPLMCLGISYISIHSLRVEGD